MTKNNCVEQMDIHIIIDRKNTIGYSLFISQWKIQAYVEDYNDILIEDDIVKAIHFNGGLYGTTDVIVDAENLFDKRVLKKKIQNKNWSKGKIWIMLAEIFGGSDKVIKCECSRNYSTG